MFKRNMGDKSKKLQEITANMHAETQKMSSKLFAQLKKITALRLKI